MLDGGMPQPVTPGPTVFNLDQARELLGRLTVNELAAEMQHRIEAKLAQAKSSAEARDLALAKTHLEDAATRYNSAAYRRKGMWKRADPDLD